MGSYRIASILTIWTTFSFSSLFSASPSDTKLQSLFLMQQNKISESLERYQEYTAMTGRHDFELLQQMGLTLLQKGSNSTDPQTLLMTLFGAGLSGSASALEILEKGIYTQDPQTQLLALHFIAKIDDDRSSDILNVAMSSDFLSTRMEAAFHLAQRKHPHAAGQIESLMFRLPPMFKPFFPSLFALIGTDEATSILRRLIEDLDVLVRIESILQVARMGRDDFIPLLRKRLTYSHVAELEAVAFAIGTLKDSASIPKLKRLIKSPADTVVIAAALSLYRLGDRSYVEKIEELAKKRNVFAIAALGQITGSEHILAELAKSSDLQVRTNASIALLQLRDPRALAGISEMILKDARDLAFQPILSIGRSLTAFKAISSAELRIKDPTVDLNYSLPIREHLLREAIHLPEKNFLQLAKTILDRQQNDVIPTLIALLENLQTAQAKELLIEGSNKLSSPLIRNYCHLSLYRLKTPGPHEEAISRFVIEQKQTDLIRLRPMLPRTVPMEQIDYSLTAEETSKLLIDSFLAIASKREERSIAFLLEAIQMGNPLNRFALMGLLMRATE